jgi:alpha-galactosidase
MQDTPNAHRNCIGEEREPMNLTATLLSLSFVGRAAIASTAPILSPINLNIRWATNDFNRNGGPFSFTYNGQLSQNLLKTWKFAANDTTPSKTTKRRVLTWTDPETQLEVKAIVWVYTDTPGVDWTLHFTNKGKSDSAIIENLRALDASRPTDKGKAIYHGIHGCYPHNWIPFDKPLAEGDPMAFGATNGCSSETHSPFFNIANGDDGMVVGVGWSGQWTASIEVVDSRLRVQAGMEFLHLKLHRGESIRSPRVLVVNYSGNMTDPYNLFRHTMFSHIMPRTKGGLQVPPISHMSTSFDELNLTDEASLYSHLKAIRGLGFEDFWLDAYYTKDGFPNGMGNYGLPIDKVTPDPVRFPNGVKPVADAVAKEGLKFLVWFEPERVAAGTLIAREHPEFVISPEGNGSGLLNLGNPQAREYMTQTLNTTIKEWHLGCLRIDYNISPLGYWQFENAKDPDRVGITEIRYVEGLYKMWDDLRASNPGLLIDNCASGGKRIDLETSSRSLALWRTDATITPLWNYDFHTAAMLNQIMTGGLNRFIPYSISGQMGSDPYNFRSGMNGGGISFAEDVRDAKDKGEMARKGREQWNSTLKDLYGEAGYPREQLKQAIIEAKRLRKFFFGDFYPQSDVTESPKDWCAFQYNRPEEHDGMVMAFRRPEAPNAFTCLGLKGIDPAATYLVSLATSYKPSKPVRMKGADLVKLELKVDECPGSVVVEYRIAN